MSTYQKPYLTPVQQVALLQSRGMVITDTARAEECLSRIGYYRLSAYWYPFRETKLVQVDGTEMEVVADHFKAGTTFSTCLGLYVFDKKMRLLVLDGLERIEVAVRTDIALLLGLQGAEAHRDPALLHGNFAKKRQPISGITGHQKWLDKQDSLFRDSKEEFVKHFKSRYPQSHLPIWMAVELWDFGMLSHFFGGMKVADKDRIAALYNVTDGQTLESWLRSLNVIRNICAHHSRLWNKPSAITPKWPKASDAPKIQHVLTDPRYHTRFYAAAVMTRHLLCRINPGTTWHKRLSEVLGTLPHSPYLNIINGGFPPDWTTLDLWK